MAVEGRTQRPVLDKDRCETCGVCLGACPAELLPEMRREEGSLRGVAHSDSDRGEARCNADKPCGPPGCQSGCPIGQDVRGYMRLLCAGRYQEALALIRETNPLPSVCGYVCHHPCESGCTRGMVDDPLSIRSLKRFLAEHGSASLPPLKRGGGKGDRVVVIGSGPAGLTAAHDLSLKGYKVEVLESYKDPGGMLAWAIPAFRLPRPVLRRDIEYIESTGVRIRTGLSFGRDETLAGLRAKGARAVIIATGAQKGVAMNIEGENGTQGCLDCLTFLRDFNDGRASSVGERTLVVGGGNAALDTARCALRQGAGKVTILYRRTPEEMPAHRDEVAEALSEGVEILFLATPVRVLSDRGRVTALECTRNEPGEPDETGRRRPVPVAGSNFTIPAETVLYAVGQRPDYEAVWMGLALKEGVEVSDPVAMLTREDNVFAAGDILTGPSSVVEAMANGRKAAMAVDAYLTRK